MAPLHEDRAVTNFRDYLKIVSVHPEPDYDGCVKFLTKLSQEIGLKAKTVQLDAKRPCLMLTWEGLQPNLPSILLNSHMDVVPVSREGWSHDPFGGHKDDNGNIFGRGAQDMKCVTIAQLETVRRLKEAGVRLKRTVHLTILPDEEIGSKDGMAKLVQRKEFADLKVGLDLDEGGPSPTDVLLIFNSERCSWGLKVHCEGAAGHGSLLHEDTAGEKLRYVIDKVMDRKTEEAAKAVPNNIMSLAQLTTIHLVGLYGGVQDNVVPPVLTVEFNMRLSVNQDHKKMDEWIQGICKKAGRNVHVEYILKDAEVPATELDEKNLYWTAFTSALDQLGLKYVVGGCFGATDARFVRGVGIPAIGASLFINTETLIHGNDEYMNETIFLDSINYYEKVVTALANV